MDVLEMIALQLINSGLPHDIVNQVTGKVRNEVGGQQHYVKGHDYPSRDAKVREAYQKTRSWSRVASQFGLSERRVREIVG